MLAVSVPLDLSVTGGVQQIQAHRMLGFAEL
jgi:hypothetical protein